MTQSLLARGRLAAPIAAPTRLLTRFGARHGHWITALIAAIYSGCLTAFAADMVLITPLAFGVFYAPLVATAIYHEDKRAVWVLAALASALVVIGALFPAVYPDIATMLTNRALSIAAVLATAAFVWHARRTQDRLADQTARAEAAERVKGEVLTNLSQEIRTPLHSMIGILELVAASGRPEHTAALTMVRGAGRRLAATVDNLVDLTQLEGRHLPPETVDLGTLLRQAVEARRRDAAARQIELSLHIPTAPPAQIHANPWAVRRILENVVGDAIAYTAPGGTVAARLDLNQDRVAAEISDTGTRPPGALNLATDPDLGRLMPSVMGIALSHRLARASGATLSYGTGGGGQTVARLTCAAADQASR